MAAAMARDAPGHRAVTNDMLVPAASGYNESINRSTRSSTALNGSLHNTVRCA